MELDDFFGNNGYNIIIDIIENAIYGCKWTSKRFPPFIQEAVEFFSTIHDYSIVI